MHFVLPGGANQGTHRPAIVVRVWRDAHGNPQPNGLVQLQVFTDGYNDGDTYRAGLVWATSVVHNEEKLAGTWHWIEPA